VDDQADAFWMARALAEAERGRGAVEPNPMVGAVVVADGRAVGIGHHAHFGGPHAEVVALAAAGPSARGATLYVTLEPCCHQGRTPPCAEAVLDAGITRVVAALRDPFPRVAGGGFDRLRAAGVAVDGGVGAGAARLQNAPYLKRLITGRPFAIAKWAMTLDGKAAAASGDSRWISGERSRAIVHDRRGRVDAIAVGIATALADDPMLTARPPGPRVATRVVLDSAARLPIGSKLVRSAAEAPVFVAANDRAPADRIRALEAAGCAVVVLPGDGPVPVAALLDELGRRGATNLVVEGGGRVLGSFFDAGEVDEVEVYIAPAIEGGDHPFGPVRGAGVARMVDALRLAEVTFQELAGDLRLSGPIARPWRLAAEAATAPDRA